MFGIGIPELIIILIVAFVVVGPEKLPRIARSLGKGFYELKRATEGVREEFEKEGEFLEEALQEKDETAKDKTGGGAVRE
ncbi:MAG: Sec-independent protein translocase protein TatB [Nitrospiria bacterium]